MKDNPDSQSKNFEPLVDILESTQASLTRDYQSSRHAAESVSNSYRQLLSYIDNVFIEINPIEKPEDSISRMVKSLTDIKTFAILEMIKHEKISSKIEGASQQTRAFSQNIEKIEER